jgi:homocysteine S-methyltransferase
MRKRKSIFEKFVDASAFVLLPGGVGTSLQQRGYRLKPGSWSGEANLTHPDLVREVHKDFRDAGAHILITNTYRTHSRQDATFGAVTVAKATATRNAVTDRPIFVGGSIGSVGDSHSHNPQTAPRLHTLVSWQTHHAKLLAELGVDALFCETIPTVNEAFAGAEAASKTGLPFTVSFALNEDGLLFDKAPLKEAIDAIKRFKPAAVTINCTPIDRIGRGLEELLEHFDGPVGAYANVGHPDNDGVHWRHDECPGSIGKFVAAALQWNSLDPARVKFPGGCCGADQLYIAALADALYGRYPAQRRIDQRFVKQQASASIPI